MAKPRVLIVRDAAIGDMIQITPGLRHFFEQGYRVDVACKPDVGAAVLANNPCVANRIDLLPQPSMKARTKAIAKIATKRPYEAVHDCVNAVENAYLFTPSHPMYREARGVRRANAAGANWTDTSLARMGLSLESPQTELHESHIEAEKWAQFRGETLGAQWVQLHLYGSSINKLYPYWASVVLGLQSLSPRVHLLLTGGPEAAGVEGELVSMPHVDKRRIFCGIGNQAFTLRDALIATKHMQLVIGPETGVMNAAGCFDTPKIVLMSHSSPANLCRHWRNAHPLVSEASCSPCYRLVPPGAPIKHTTTGTWVDECCLCMAGITPDRILMKAKEILQC